MDGKYLDEHKVQKSIQNWKHTIISSNRKWEANNLHIDEIESLDKIKRSEWIDVSLLILNMLMKQFKQVDSLILFLHIDLKYSFEEMLLEKLSLNWLKENVNEYTPPSLHFTSLEYYNDFYKQELVPCKPNKSILRHINFTEGLNFFYRTYFDEDEKMYSREIYVFLKN